jgi:DNA-binding protein YbaB
LIEDLLLAALRDGIGKATRISNEQMGKVTGGINLPGLF